MQTTQSFFSTVLIFSSQDRAHSAAAATGKRSHTSTIHRCSKGWAQGRRVVHKALRVFCQWTRGWDNSPDVQKLWGRCGRDVDQNRPNIIFQATSGWLHHEGMVRWGWDLSLGGWPGRPWRTLMSVSGKESVGIYWLDIGYVGVFPSDVYL